MATSDAIALLATILGIAWMAHYLWCAWVKSALLERLPALWNGSHYPPTSELSSDNLHYARRPEAYTTSGSVTQSASIDESAPFSTESLAREWVGAGPLDVFGHAWEPARHDE